MSVEVSQRIVIYCLGIVLFGIAVPEYIHPETAKEFGYCGFVLGCLSTLGLIWVLKEEKHV
jgi:hypothetical protein